MRDIELLLESQTHWERAIRKDDVPTANRYALRMTHAVRRLRETEAGRTELEKLLTHPKPNLRLWALVRRNARPAAIHPPKRISPLDS